MSTWSYRRLSRVAKLCARAGAPHILYGGGGCGVAIRLDRDVDIVVAGERHPLRELRIGVDDADALAATLS